MKGLTFAPTGALIAAATTSLPETPGGERNWDYRYSWVRDSTFALWGLYSLGFDWEANDFFNFIADVAQQSDELQVMYGVGGERTLTEDILDHLHGYDGAKPVRIGNGAHDQRQHDVWGAVLDSVYMHTKSRDRLDERTWSMLRRQVESALDHWREAGPGHVGGPRRPEALHVVQDHVLGGCRSRCAPRPHPRGHRAGRRVGGGGARRSTTTSARTASTIAVCSPSTTTPRRSTHHCCSQHSSASSRPMTGGSRPPCWPSPTSSPSTTSCCAIGSTRPTTACPVRKGTFVICSFWLVSALVEIGEYERARALCEKLLSFASPLGLYAEEIDARSGRHLGNFPQAFTHLALINAVIHVIESEVEAVEPNVPRVLGSTGA